MCPPSHTDPSPDWEQVYAQHFSDRMPEAVFLALPDDEKSAVLTAWQASGQGRTLFRLPVETELAALTNRGLAYLLLAAPTRYALWERASEDLVLELLAWDADHLDDTHTQLMTGPREELLLDQRLRTFCALLHNASVTADTVRTLLAGLQQAWDTTYPGPPASGDLSLADVLDYQLWDKWSPEEFPPGTLAVLEGFFRDHGLAYAADRMTPPAMDALRAAREAEDAD